jgi:hypothetical protein
MGPIVTIGPNQMKIFSNILLIASAIVGIVAAGYWWRASRPVGDPFHGRGESGDTGFNQTLMTGATMESVNQSAALNKLAALWTAISVLLGAIGNVLSACA